MRSLPKGIHVAILSAVDRRRKPHLRPKDVLARHRGGPTSGVFTDGSCQGNPGPGGWGVVWVASDRILAERCGGDPATTNNRMELRALVEAYRMLPTSATVHVYSDSQLCVRTINEWAPGWAARGWRRKTGPIANLELVRELYDLAQNHRSVQLHWIAAHAGSRWNEYADALAANAGRERK